VTTHPTCCLRLGRFRLLEQIGQGSQGVVYRAEDTADGSIVAIKVLRPEWASRREVLRRFRKEARILAEVNNPNVVNLLEYNEDAGVAYLVLELVTGRSLHELLARGKLLDEPLALAIASDVARGLREAHKRGIVHRDVKPGNILLLDPAPAPPVAATQGGSVLRTHLRVKLSDFGLARHLVESESLALTEPGALLGTPQYMAPEQCTGRMVDPRTDVYALGATLFHMLASRPPFVAESRDQLYELHCHEPPPPIEKYNPAASPGVGQVVARALAKAPEDRYADAGAMLRDLERLLHGEPTAITIHPITPSCDPREILHYDFRWELRASPRQLWPLVSNTERVNRAVGLPVPRFSARYDADHGVRRFGTFRKLGLVVDYEEHPFEWVEPRRFGVLREFSRGPFRWYTSVVELHARPGGGTTLFHRVRVMPRGVLGRVAAPWEIGHKGRWVLDRIYRRIDAALTGRLGQLASVDPFEGPAVLSAARRRRLDVLLDTLAGLGIDPAVVERLDDFLAHAPAQEVARIRPLTLARCWGLDPNSVVSACLHGAREGLLTLLWDILCPTCRLSCEIKDTLRAIRDHGHCVACHLDFRLDFADSVELIFRAHPEVRDVDTGTYCIGGPAHSPHVLAQVRVAPSERLELELALPEGSYRLRSPQLPWSIDFRVHTAASTRYWDLTLSQGPPPELSRILASGGQLLALTNDYERELLVRVERTALRDDALTAARASALALFRDLFPGEVLSPGQLVSLATVTLLVTDLDRADELYEKLGDARAFGVIHEHFRLLEDAIRRAGGAMVKTVGEGVITVFGDPSAAVRVGLELPSLMARGTTTRGLRIRAAIHRGAATAATLNDRLDYFGATVRQATRLLQIAPGGGLVLSRELAADPQVATLLEAHGHEGEILRVDLPSHPYALLFRSTTSTPSAEEDPVALLPSRSRYSL
jgi:serine/threonine protein kinase/class 3 adenylate cyclase